MSKVNDILDSHGGYYIKATKDFITNGSDGTHTNIDAIMMPNKQDELTKQQLLAEVLDASPKHRLSNQEDYLDYPPMYSQGYNEAINQFCKAAKERFK